MDTFKAELRKQKLAAANDALNLVHELKLRWYSRVLLAGFGLALVLIYTWICTSVTFIKLSIKYLLRFDVRVLTIPVGYTYTVMDLTLFYCWLAMQIVVEEP